MSITTADCHSAITPRLTSENVLVPLHFLPSPLSPQLFQHDNASPSQQLHEFTCQDKEHRGSACGLAPLHGPSDLPLSPLPFAFKGSCTEAAVSESALSLEPHADPMWAGEAKAVAWAQLNPWFGSIEDMTEYAFLVHDQLVDVEGLDASSDLYYAELERRVAIQFPLWWAMQYLNNPPATPFVSQAQPALPPSQLQLLQSQIRPESSLPHMQQPHTQQSTSTQQQLPWAQQQQPQSPRLHPPPVLPSPPPQQPQSTQPHAKDSASSPAAATPLQLHHVATATQHQLQHDAPSVSGLMPAATSAEAAAPTTPPPAPVLEPQSQGPHAAADLVQGQSTTCSEDASPPIRLSAASPAGSRPPAFFGSRLRVRIKDPVPAELAPCKTPSPVSSPCPGVHNLSSSSSSSSSPNADCSTPGSASGAAEKAHRGPPDNSPAEAPGLQLQRPCPTGKACAPMQVAAGPGAAASCGSRTPHEPTPAMGNQQGHARHRQHDHESDACPDDSDAGSDDSGSTRDLEELLLGGPQHMQAACHGAGPPQVPTLTLPQHLLRSSHSTRHSSSPLRMSPRSGSFTSLASSSEQGSSSSSPLVMSQRSKLFTSMSSGHRSSPLRSRRLSALDSMRDTHSIGGSCDSPSLTQRNSAPLAPSAPMSDKHGSPLLLSQRFSTSNASMSGRHGSPLSPTQHYSLVASASMSDRQGSPLRASRRYSLASASMSDRHSRPLKLTAMLQEEPWAVAVSSNSNPSLADPDCGTEAASPGPTSPSGRPSLHARQYARCLSYNPSAGSGVVQALSPTRPGRCYANMARM